MDKRIPHPTETEERQEPLAHLIPSGGQAACRAMRILQILQEKTDTTTLLPFDDIVTELKEPSDERLPSIPTDRRALSTAVGALRAVGVDIVNIPRAGYAILKHPLSDEEAAMLGKLVIHSTDINARQRGSLLASIMRLSSPTARQNIEMALLRHPTFGGQKPVTEYRVSHAEPRELIEMAVSEQLPFSFELDERTPQSGQVTASSYRPQALYPTALTDRYGTTFVTGEMVNEADGEIRMRTIMVSRLRNLTLRLRDGSTVFAALRDGRHDPQRETDAAPLAV